MPHQVLADPAPLAAIFAADPEDDLSDRLVERLCEDATE
jgi:hypothetical protein